MKKFHTTPSKRKLNRICVYCASSNNSDPKYREAAYETGKLLAHYGSEIIYGGGTLGSMGALADGALAEGGHVIGVLPEFMVDLEWGHTGLSELKIVPTLHKRKQIMIDNSDGIIAMPGGSGTFEELMEALTWKRLALYNKPIILLNTLSYFDSFQALMEKAINEKFMHKDHFDMWGIVNTPNELIAALLDAPDWDMASIKLAIQR